MIRILQAVLFLMLPLLLSSQIAAGSGNWVVVEEEGAAASPAPQSFTAQEMQRMGVFLSNFTEVGLYDVDAAQCQESLEVVLREEPLASRYRDVAAGGDLLEELHVLAEHGLLDEHGVERL